MTVVSRLNGQGPNLDWFRDPAAQVTSKCVTAKTTVRTKERPIYD
jgi:hypothetical protein